MSANALEALLTERAIAYTMHTHQPLLTVADMEAHLPFPSEQFLKTLAFKIKDAFWVLAAMRGPARIDYRKLAAAYSISRSHIIRPSAEEVQSVLGYATGGVAPVVPADNTTTRLVVDEAAATMTTVYCGGGRSDRTLEIALSDLITLSNGLVAPISRDES